MKKIILGLGIIAALASCNNNNKIIVSSAFVDSLLTHYDKPPAIKDNEAELNFWKKRMDTQPAGIVNELKYASNLVARFQLNGDIKDVRTADSILKTVDNNFNHKEAAPVLALMRHAILQHRFMAADSLLTVAKMIGLKPSESLAASFDVDFETGRINMAKKDLEKMANENDYGFNFRQSKIAHFNADVDKAIAAMQRSADLAGNDIGLKQAAISNVADLYLHNGKLQKAYEYYCASIRLSATDLHSMMGIAWIALLHDKNDSLAEKILLFVHTKTGSPEPLFKLAQTAEARGDKTLAEQYARSFEKQVTDTIYGNMYNKYLVQLYTGILHEPAKAEAIAKKELLNRNTPQTEAWYVWALYSNNNLDEAYKVYQHYVSGKPLEGLELYWMGKLMQGLKKGYNAKQFFTEAAKNKYDLSPAMMKDLDKQLD